MSQAFFIPGWLKGDVGVGVDVKPHVDTYVINTSIKQLWSDAPCYESVWGNFIPHTEPLMSPSPVSLKTIAEETRSSAMWEREKALKSEKKKHACPSYRVNKYCDEYICVMDVFALLSSFPLSVRERINLFRFVSDNVRRCFPQSILRKIHIKVDGKDVRGLHYTRHHFPCILQATKDWMRTRIYLKR